MIDGTHILANAVGSPRRIFTPVVSASGTKEDIFINNPGDTLQEGILERVSCTGWWGARKTPHLAIHVPGFLLPTWYCPQLVLVGPPLSATDSDVVMLI